MAVVYDPRKTSIVFNKFPITGLGAGDFFKATRRKEPVTLEELGADGEGAFTLTGDHSYDVEVTLKKSSKAANKQLLAWANSARLGSPIVGNFTMSDPSNGYTFTGSQAMIVNIPEELGMRSGGDTFGEVTWKFAVKEGAEKID